MKNAWRSPGLGAALIVLLTFVAYLPALHSGFVFDDNPLIIDNRIIRASDGLYRFWFTAEAPDYYPLTSSLWWLEWRSWGNDATGYHVVNVVLHIVNALLVWMILRRLKIPGAWLAALVFGVHPVNVATVAWISEQKNTLSMLFYALSILLYLRFDEEERLSRSDWAWRWYGFSLGAFLLALLSKTAVVMLPVVLLGCVWWRHGRVRGKDFLRSMPFFALSLILGLITIWFQHYRALQGQVIRTESFAFRLAAAGWVPWFYLYKILLPFHLTLIYPKWVIDASRWVSYVPGMLLIGCFIVFWWRRKTWGRPGLFGLGYFLVMLFPVLGFVDQGFYRGSLVADHWQYFSIVGVIALVVAAGIAICRRTERSRHAGGWASAAVLLVLAVTTWRRSCVYVDAETLWRDTVTENPNAWLAYYNLGVSLRQAGRMQEAMEQYEQALRVKPDYADAHNNLANALLQSGKIEEAIGHYEQALRIQPDVADVHNNLGFALMLAGRRADGIQHYEQALRIKPDFAAAHYNLGVALAQAGLRENAITHFERTLQIRPDYVEAYNDLGIALAQTGKIPDAIREFEQALRIRPDCAEAHYNLGIAMERSGRPAEAIAHFNQALRIKPDYAQAQNELVRLRAVR